MKLTVFARPGSSKNKIEKLSDNTYRTQLTAPPINGKANEALIKLLAEYFNIPKSTVKIIRGLKSKTKIIEIQD